jgi:hypothetical protein
MSLADITAPTPPWSPRMSAPQVSRRSVARGAAWSVPLVAVGVAAPAFAASGSRVTATDITVCQCAGGGVKRYQVSVTFTNSSASPINLTGIEILEGGVPVPTQNTATGTVNAGTDVMLTFYVTRQSNGATGTFGINYTVPGFPQQSYTTPGAIGATGACLNACPPA